MMMNFPKTVWSEKHARTLDAAATLTFAPLSMFGGLSPTVAQAATNEATTTASSGTATDQWNAAIEAKVRPGVTRQQAAVLVAKEQPQLQAAYIDEYRRQAARR